MQQVLDYQKQSGTKSRIGDLLIELGYITELQKLEALGKRLNYDLVDINTYKVDSEAVKKIPKQTATKYHAIAIGKEEEGLVLAINDPLDFYGI